MTSTKLPALKASSVLWVIWGLVHVFAGMVILTGDATTGFQAVLDAVAPETLVHDYAPGVGGILNQHGWNLAWIGLATTVGAFFIWQKNLTAIWVTGMVGGLTDLGYLFFVDLPGYVHFFPGTLMTIVSGTAVLLSFWVWLTERKKG